MGQKFNNLFPVHTHLQESAIAMGSDVEDSKKTLSRLLLEYLKDSNRSDREIAKDLGISQATVSRLKRKLLKDGLVRHFSAISDLGKMGYEIMAFSLVKFNTESVMKDFGKVIKMAQVWAKTHPEIIFDARAEGMGVDVVTISLHKTYAAYKEFLAQNKRTWGSLLSEVHFILVDLNGPLSKPFSFEYLADDTET